MPWRPVRARSLNRCAGRIHLRLLSRNDAPAFVAAVVASRSLHGSWVNPPATPEAFRRRFHTSGGMTDRVALVGGRWRDHECWAINADDWKARSKRALAKDA